MSNIHVEINDMEFEVRKSFYHKTYVQEDGVTHIVDTEHPHTVYQFGLAKNYFTEDEDVFIGEIIGDLKCVIEHLERLQERNRDKGKSKTLER